MATEYSTPPNPQDFKPWEYEGSIWKTEGAYWSWIRSGIRKTLWSKYPIKNHFILVNRFKAPIGKNGREIFAGRCNNCKKVFKIGELVIDHIIPNVPLKNNVDGYLKTLHISIKGMQFMCDPCHEIKTIIDAQGCTVKEAEQIRRTNKFKKLSAANQHLYLIERHHNGEELKNEPLRIKAFESLPISCQS